jgi:uncharacterized protein YndB with AHSA1/START domain
MATKSAPREAGRMGDAAVQAKTGKSWAEWFAALDALGASGLDHKGIVTLLDRHFDIGGWWQQMVTVTYEQERGLRTKHQKPDGYEVSGSKTIAASAAAAFAAWHDPALRARWLEEPITIRKATPGRSLRITWSDGIQDLDVMLYPRGEGRCQVTTQHGRLPDAETAARMKRYWAERLEQLKALLEAGGWAG